jgi:hypothetical protein
LSAAILWCRLGGVGASALLATGIVKCRGESTDGELGNNNNTNSPVSVFAFI